MLFSNCKSNTQVSCVCVTWMGGVIMLSVPEYSQTWLKKPIRVYGRNNWEWIVKYSCLFSHGIPGELFIVQSGNYCNDLETTGRVTGGYICVSGYRVIPELMLFEKRKCDIILWLGSVRDESGEFWGGARSIILPSRERLLGDIDAHISVWGSRELAPKSGACP